MILDSKGGDKWPANSKISVWWDYESCQVPKSADGGLIVNNIAFALMNLNLSGPITFSAYGDVKMIPESVLEAMHMTGITMIHAPGGKNASNLHIIGDMSLWAVHNPPPATYVLISGDQDFSHSLSRLSHRGYKILLVRSDNHCSSLDWSWTDICEGPLAVKSVIGNLFKHRSQMQEQENRFPLDDDRLSSKSLTSKEGSYSSLEDLKDKVLSVAMDQHGSQFLCQQLQKQTTEDTEAIFSEVKHHVCVLMLDQFGRNVMQELFLNCSKEQLRYLVSTVTADFHLFKALCLHSQGSRFLREFLYSDLMTEEEVAHMISALKEMVILLLKDKIGARLIQHCFHIFSEKDTKPILDVIVSNCCQIAADKSGCCLLQDLLLEGKGRPTEKFLVAAIMDNLYDLSINQFGNYLVQRLIEIGPPSLAAAMVDALTRKFDYLSMDKYGIHVVERLMEAYGSENSSKIIDEIIRNPDSSRAVLSCLVQSAMKHRPASMSPTDEKGSYSSLEDLKDKVLSVAMDQQGSQFLCQQLQKQTMEDTEAIFSEVKDHVCLLMLDRFGRNVTQELFLNCSKEQLRYLVSTVTADFHLFKTLCLHSQGSRFLWEFLYSDLMTEEEIAHMISALKEMAILLLKDEIGARLIQHCFHIFSEKDTKPIFDVIVSNCRQIAATKVDATFCKTSCWKAREGLPKSASLQR